MGTWHTFLLKVKYTLYLYQHSQQSGCYCWVSSMNSAKAWWSLPWEGLQTVACNPVLSKWLLWVAFVLCPRLGHSLLVMAFPLSLLALISWDLLSSALLYNVNMIVSFTFVDFSRAERTRRVIVCMSHLLNMPSVPQPLQVDGWPLLPSLMSWLHICLFWLYTLREFAAP